MSFLLRGLRNFFKNSPQDGKKENNLPYGGKEVKG